MKRSLIILAFVVVGLTTLILFPLLLESSASKAMAKDFFINLTGGDPAAAHAVLHPGLQQEYSLEFVAAEATRLETYGDVTFNSFRIENNVISYSGVAKAPSGCESQVEITILNERVTQFSISPPCPSVGTDA